MKRRYLAVAIIAGAAVIAWLRLNAQAPRRVEQTHPHATSGQGQRGERKLAVRVGTAKQEKIDRVVEATGSIIARREVSVASEVTAKVMSITIEEGQRVTAGQVLVRLDDTDARARVARARAALEQANSRLAQAHTLTRLTAEGTASGVLQADAQLLALKARAAQAASVLRLTEEQTRYRITQAQKDLEAARENLRLLQAGTRPQQKAEAEAAVGAAQAEIEQLQAALTQAETDVKEAQLENDRMQGLLEQGFASQQQADKARFRLIAAQTGVAATRARLTSSRTRLRQAEEHLSLLREGARPEEIAIAKARVEQSEAALAEAESQKQQIEVRRKELEEAQLKVREQEHVRDLARANRGKVKASEEEIEAIRSNVEQAKADLVLAEQNLRDCTVLSPISGTVARRLVEPGSVATPGMPLLRLLSGGSMFFAAEIPEKDIARVSVGQHAEVRVDALPHTRLSGRVVEVLPEGEGMTRRFLAKVLLVNPRSELREGMFARGQIIVQRQVSVVLVPLDAVVRRKGKEFVAVVHSPSSVEIREVRLGDTREEYVEIARGIAPGEVVVTQGAQMLKPTSHVEIVQ